MIYIYIYIYIYIERERERERERVRATGRLISSINYSYLRSDLIAYLSWQITILFTLISQN